MERISFNSVQALQRTFLLFRDRYDMKNLLKSIQVNILCYGKKRKINQNAAREKQIVNMKRPKTFQCELGNTSSLLQFDASKNVKFF